jgi:hypothetical protein
VLVVLFGGSFDLPFEIPPIFEKDAKVAECVVHTKQGNRGNKDFAKHNRNRKIMRNKNEE